MPTAVRILLVSGSTRSGSTNTAALRTVRSVTPDGVSAELYQGIADLPHFNPDDDHEPLHPLVAELRRKIARSDAVLFCTPEYAGALPGSFKNLLDWTVGGTDGRDALAPDGTVADPGFRNAVSEVVKVLRSTAGESEVRSS